MGHSMKKGILGAVTLMVFLAFGPGAAWPPASGEAVPVLARDSFAGKFSLPERSFLEIPIGVAVAKGKHGEFPAKVNEGAQGHNGRRDIR